MAKTSFAVHPVCIIVSPELTFRTIDSKIFAFAKCYECEGSFQLHLDVLYLLHFSIELC